MEQIFIYPAIPPTDRASIENKKLLECKGLVIDIDNHSIKKKRRLECKELIIDIPLELEASRCPDKYCIYRVPKRLREVNNKAYTPRLVSIGPFHHRREELKDMDKKKFLILKNFCNRTGKNIEDLKCIIRPKEMEIRSCYSETFLLSSEGFLNMILLDAIFILELFHRKYENSKAQEKDSGNSKAHYEIDYILSRPCIERGIQHDLLLLENQLPFFVLKKLYQHAEPNTRKKTLIEISCWFFGDLYYGWKPESKNRFNDLVGYFFAPQNSSPSSPKHFTDLVRYFFLPLGPNQSSPKPSEENRKEGPKGNKTHLHFTATKLNEAGLKFIPTDPETYLLDINFRENICLESLPYFNLSWFLSCLPCLKSTCLFHMQRFLEVPPLQLDDKTEGLFRNLMALEQCHYPSETYICDYIVLLDDLITTKADVRLLVDKKIIVNELGSSAAVTKLVNNLGLEIEERGNHYAELCGKLNKYSESNWNRLVGTLTSVYFTDFFKGTATVLGIIVLGLTLWNFNRLLRLSGSKY
ncbi:hypothetical protein F2P56_010556 [Juglans regia]|uniref:UPF0481 protein At3g47200-like n=2 Tax=Juglans regia TaxID=51240 RepID=A0A2I4EKA6_JUGRE|nr:UPF0481 protein At3g47200-like [Juglans regia]XP_018819824.1 UPF0481 protein At3g47200-like [Juglans regia]KAF5470002.1 hypothetical protein F2P56_010556 [Juglans regia]